MQAVTNPPQKTPAVTEPLSLNIRQHPQANQLFDIRGAKLPVTNPERGMNVAQSPRRGFDVGF